MSRFSKTWAEDRNVDELVGIAMGAAADGEVNQKEAEFIAQWLEAHREIINDYPANLIYGRLKEMLSDGVLDNQEKVELFELLNDLSGGASIATDIKSMATTLPLDAPMTDPIAINGFTFCLTGQFAAGTREHLHNVIRDLGGYVDKNITKKTNYLVVGLVGNENWIHSSHGRKIEKAVVYRDEKGTGISIVSEEHWIGYLVNGYGG